MRKKNQVLVWICNIFEAAFSFYFTSKKWSHS